MACWNLAASCCSSSVWSLPSLPVGLSVSSCSPEEEEELTLEVAPLDFLAALFAAAAAVRWRFTLHAAEASLAPYPWHVYERDNDDLESTNGEH